MKPIQQFAKAIPLTVLVFTAQMLVADKSWAQNERCGGFQSISLTDWEAGLGAWTVGTYGRAQPEAFDTPDWDAVGGLPDSRAGKAAFVANLDLGACPGDDQSGVLTLTSPSIDIPADANGQRIALNHWFDIEEDWDGGNLKISVNEGPFTLVPGSAFETGPYTGVLFEAIRDTLPYNANPLAEQEAFTGPGLDLAGGSWGVSRVNLNLIDPAIAGKSIQLRFDFGIDDCWGEVGWYVDEVEVYSCEAELGKIDQTITGLAADPAAGVVDGTSALSATASSGLAVTFGSSTGAVCTVAGSTVTYLSTGTCTVTANQAGDDDYNAATQVTTNITVAKADQTISAFAANPANGRIGNQTGDRLVSFANGYIRCNLRCHIIIIITRLICGHRTGTGCNIRNGAVSNSTNGLRAATEGNCQAGAYSCTQC